MNLKQSVNVIALIALAAMFFSTVVTILWGLDKSLGLGDEGIYLLSARFPEDVRQNVSAVYVYTGFLFRIANYDPATFRLIGMVIGLISAFIFWMGINKYFLHLEREAARTKAVAIRYTLPYSLFFIGIGAMLYYQWFFATPNNYTLTAVAINIFAGTLLLGLSLLSDWKKNIKSILFAFSVAGLSLGLAFFTKPPSGICLISLCFLVIVLLESICRSQKFILMIAVLFGCGVWFTGHFILILSPGSSWQMFQEGWALYQSLGVHVPQIKFLLYSKEILNLFYSAIKIFWPSYLILGGVFAYSFSRRKARHLSENVNFGILFIVLVVVVFQSAKPGVYIDERTAKDGTIPFYVVFYLACVLLLLTIVICKKWYDKAISLRKGINIGISLNDKIVLALLILLPIAGAIGTGNSIFSVTGFYSVPWFGAIFLLLIILVINNQNNFWLMPCCGVLIGAFATSQIIQGSIFNPSQISAYLHQQVLPTYVGFPRKTPYLDQQTHDLVQKLSSIANANGFKYGNDVVAISYLPSIVFAMGGRSPGHPVFLSGSKAAEDYSKLALQFADITRLRKAFILINISKTDAAAILASRGLNFPEEYKQIGAVDTMAYNVTTTYSLWKPVNVEKD